MTLTKLSGETTVATPQPAISVPSLRLKPPSVKSLQPGDSIPVSLAVIRQVGDIIKKWSGEPEGFKSEEAHPLISVSPRGTQGSHRFNSSVLKLAEKKTQAAVGSLQVLSSDEVVQESSNHYA